MRNWFNENNRLLLIAVAIIFCIASFVLGFMDKATSMAVGAMLAIVFLFMAYLDDLEEFVVSLKEMRFKRRKKPIEEETTETQEDELKEAAGELRNILRRGAHSFQYFRDHSRIKLDDEKFEELIRENSDFKKVTIVERDEKGNRVIPGRPGIKLK